MSFVIVVTADAAAAALLVFLFAVVTAFVVVDAMRQHLSVFICLRLERSYIY